MGIKIELSANSREPLSPGQWQATLTKFEHGKSSVKETPFVQPVFKMTDEDAVRQDGEPFKGNVWGDKYWVTSGALFRLKEFVDALGSELPGEGTEVEGEAEYAEMLTDALSGTDVTITTGLRPYEKDGETRYAVEVTDVS